MSKQIANVNGTGLAATRAEMQPVLQKKFDEILSCCRKIIGGTIMSTWELGAHVAALTDNPKNYGTQAIETVVRGLAQAGMGEFTYNELTDARQLSRAFSKDEVRDLLSRRTESGKSITVTHIRHLVSLTAKQRKPYIERIFKEDLTVRELEQVVQATTGSGTRGGGPKLKPPRTAEAGLHQIQTFAGHFDDKRLKLWHTHVFGKLAKTSADNITPVTKQQLEKTKASLQAMEDAVVQLKGELAEVESRIESVLAQKSSKATAEAETAQAEQDFAVEAETNGVAHPATPAKSSKKKPPQKKAGNGKTSQDRLAAARRRAPQTA